MNVEAAETGSRRWKISTDAAGVFDDQGLAGNLRIAADDTLIIEVPAGALVNQHNACELHVESGNGNLTTLKPESVDVFGNARFVWSLGHKDATGPVSFQLVSIPFTNEATTISGPVNQLVVEPLLRRTNGRSSLRPRSIAMQTVLPSCLGTIDRWPAVLSSGTSACNYNMIHLTPVQVRGESGSCYSLADQLKVEPSLIPTPDQSAAATTNNETDSCGWSILGSTLTKLRQEQGLLSACDVVLNHVANNCTWLPEHPEVGYHQDNCPWLRGAIELDQRIQEFSLAVSQDKYRNQGLSSYISDESAVRSLRRLFQQYVLDPFRVGEWFAIDRDGALHEWRSAQPGAGVIGKTNKSPIEQLEIECLKTVGVARQKGVKPRGDVTRSLFPHSENSFRAALDQVQQKLWNRAGETVNSILNAIEGTVRWERLECRKGRVGPDHWDGLVPRYFTPVTATNGKVYYMANNGWVMDWPASEDFAGPGTLVYLSRSLVAWSDCVKLNYGSRPEDSPFLWNHMKEYCVLTAKHFDGIRLDNCHSTPLPVAQHMLKAARMEKPNLFVFAELFTGSYEADLKFERLLGLHALIREALQSKWPGELAHHLRQWGGKPFGTLDSRPSLEQESGNDTMVLRATDPLALIFDCTHDNETPAQRRTAVDTLSNAAVCAMAGCAIGSVRGYDELVPKTLSVVSERRLYRDYSRSNNSTGQNGATTNNGCSNGGPRFRTSLRPYSRSIHVMGSWDNWTEPVPLQRVGDVWECPLPANIMNDEQQVWQYKFIADNSQWFFDSSLPHCEDGHGNTNNVISCRAAASPIIDCVEWTPGHQSLPGIMTARRALNALHYKLEAEGFTEVDVAVKNENFIIIRRHKPDTHQLCVMVARTAFHRGALLGNCSFTWKIAGQLQEDSPLLEASLTVSHDAIFKDNDRYINGLPSSINVGGSLIHPNDRCSNLFTTEYDDVEDTTTITISNSMSPGSVFVVMNKGNVPLRNSVRHAVSELESLLPSVMGTRVDPSEELLAYNYLLYSCSNEELDRSRGTRNCYALTDGRLRYAGIAGVVPQLDQLRRSSTFDGPLAQNLIAGDWLMEYLCDRLDTDSEEDGLLPSGVVLVLVKIASWMRDTFNFVVKSSLSRRFRPYYVDVVVSSVYNWVARRVMAIVPPPLRNSTDSLIQRLCLATLQLYSFVPSAPLIHGTRHPSLCAGLPHFSTNFMRAWGRDTFIAIRGCLLDMGRWKETREEILGFARVMRHGLIPNLLDSGNNPRYNARDATWFFMKAVVDYCIMSPEGIEFLDTKVTLKYQPDDGEVTTMAQLIKYIFERHAQGMEFREWNAGRALDEHMKDEGFNIKIKLDEATGFIHGGNRWNCGTWMDKMGSSAAAGNKGIPATPRDGAPVEIIGLLKSVLRFVNKLPASYGFDVVNSKTGYTYAQWEQRLQDSFYRHFYVPDDEDIVNQSTSFKFNRDLVNRRGIIKDTYGATEEWRDYQLRPNFFIALAVAPELVPVEAAGKALDNAAKYLLLARSASEYEAILKSKNKDDAVAFGKALRMTFPKGLVGTPLLGPKTLDPSDMNYRPNYNNSDQSSDPSVAHGFNYHNGPEWVWPLGYFLEALYHNLCHRNNRKNSARHTIMGYLLLHRDFMAKDPWLSLPEVTDANATYCEYSCQAQAWSVGTVLAACAAIARDAGTNDTEMKSV